MILALPQVAIGGGRKTIRWASLRRAWRAGGRRLRLVRGRFRGARYAALGRQPKAGVADAVLVARVRSRLGPLGKRLDLPRIRVMVCDGVAVLHGSVGTVEDAELLAAATADVPGVRRISSHLHVGLGREETRPSTSRVVLHRLPPPAVATTGRGRLVPVAAVAVARTAGAASAEAPSGLPERPREGRRATRATPGWLAGIYATNDAQGTMPAGGSPGDAIAETPGRPLLGRAPVRKGQAYGGGRPFHRRAMG